MFPPKASTVATSAPPTQSAWQPVFQQTVQSFGYGLPFGAAVNPFYCLTEESAKELSGMLSDLSPTVTHMLPFGPLFYGHIIGMETPLGVPWLAFADGTILNAGSDLAACWTHGWNDALAMRYCRGIIALAQRQTAMGQ